VVGVVSVLVVSASVRGGGARVSSMPQRGDEQLQTLIQGLLHKDPADRPELATVLENTFCSEASALDVNLTEVLSPLAKKDNNDKQSLMRAYMDDEDNSEDEVSEASTAEDNHDKLDQERERVLDGSDGCNGRRQAPGAEQDEVQKMNQALRGERVQKLTQGVQGCVVC